MPSAASSKNVTHGAAETGQDPGALRRVLKLPSLVLFGLVYMVPLTVFTTYGLVTQETGGRLPTAYLVTLIAMLFTAMSYGAMVKAYPTAGSAFTYTQKSFGGNAGFLAGWSLLLDYLFLPMINYLVIGIYLNAQFPAIPAWVFVLGCIIAVTVLNVIGINTIARMNVLIVGLQAVFVIVFLVLAIKSATGTGVSLFEPFTGSSSYGSDGVDPSSGFSPLLAGAAVLCLSFLGFDAVSTLAEETPNPRRDIPRAILLVTIGAGLLFVLLSYLAHLVLPEPTCLAAVDPECTFVDSASVDVMLKAGGEFLSTFFVAAYVTGAFGSALTSQASVSRILFTMGRDGVLPHSFFGKLQPKFGTPMLSILLVSAISLLALWIDLATLASMISFGALVAFSAVNLSVIKHYLVDEKLRATKDLVLYGVLPVIGCILTAWLWTSLSSESLTIGLIWLGVGALYLAVLTRGFTRKPPAMDISEH